MSQLSPDQNRLRSPTPNIVNISQSDGESIDGMDGDEERARQPARRANENPYAPPG